MRGRRLPRIMIAAPSSGAGKTTITCGLLQALISRRISCTAWKCGPDYIDPMFHKYVLGVSGGNLDSFFLKEKEVCNLLSQGTPQGHLAVIEGVMGYFDGLAGISVRASSYDIARITRTPVILVVDCKGASLSVAAVVKGFLDYETDETEKTAGNFISGVLLNRISQVMAERLKPQIEALGVPVVGWIPVQSEMEIKSRHLGLLMPEEISRLREQLDKLGEMLEQTVDMELILKIAGQATEMEENVSMQMVVSETIPIAVARDEAFCFYYQENRKLLERLGAKLLFFSPLHDEGIPRGAKGLILGGGYPELYGNGLSANVKMRESVKKMVLDGLPLLAECGGFLYLHEKLEDPDGNWHPMVGAIRGTGFKTGRLSRFGYLTLTPTGKDSCFMSEIKGHEFHYWDSTDCGCDWVAKKPLVERSWTCMHSSRNQIAGFPHLYYPSDEAFISRWLKACKGDSEPGRKGGEL